jgi:hypothetical protein
MLAHRPFLLNMKRRNDDDTRGLAKNSVVECIAAARAVLEAVDRMAKEGRLFHAFWWTHYVCFCALLVVYVWAIQESNHSTTSGNDCRNILDQAERCLQHLAQATASNSPSRKYSIILQELQTEAKRKIAKPMHERGVPASSDTSIGGAGTTGHTHATTHEDMTDAAVQMWQPLYGSPMETSTPGLQSFLDNWQTTDWLDLDSSAFGHFQGPEDIEWINHTS